MDDRRNMVMIPTYNEGHNIGTLVRAIAALADRPRVVVVDDGSTDGTRETVEKISREDPNVEIIERSGKRGRGLAGREGFLYALKSGAECVIEMDGDLSHDPAAIPEMLAAIKDCDIVIGSRFIPGGIDQRRSFLRSAISLSAKIVINAILGIEVSDPTSGFRCFRRKALEDLHPETLKAETPFIVLETLYRAFRNGARIKEVPIVFRPRNKERSKLSFAILIRCFVDVIKLRFEREGA